MTWGCEWRHAPEARAEDFEDFEESQLVESCGPKKKGDFRLLAETLWLVPHVLWGGRWKRQHRKIVPLSLCRKKNFKLKGNKKFRTWTKKSSSVFRVSGFLYSMYICYEHSMYVSHIFMYGYVTMSWVFATGPGDRDSIPDRIIPKTKKNTTWCRLA